jgi:hypothetical protein
MTVVVAYNAGSYGTYVEWCLTTLINHVPIIPPFTNRGNSHNFKGAHLGDVNGWLKYINSNEYYSIARLHPKTQIEQSLDQNLNFICDTAKSVIYLYPDVDSVLLCLNNYTTKTAPNWWKHQFDYQHINSDSIYQNWPLHNSCDIDQVSRWIRREFLSFYLVPAWFDQIEWYHPAHWSHPNACVVTVTELLFNFESTLSKIQRHCNLEFVKPTTDLLPYHQQNLNLQANIGQDSLCKNIVDCVLLEKQFNWGTLPLASEAWIQWQLRNLGWEIRCHELDIFPTNSIQLKELLYPV